MTTDFLPNKDSALSKWLDDFTGSLANYQSTLGITTAQMLQINQDKTTFQTALADVSAAKNTLKTNVTGKRTARQKAEDDVRALAKLIQGNPNATPTIKSALGLNPGNTPREHTLPVTPTVVTATAASNGVNTLRWHRNGNKPTTVFIVEAQIGDSTAWVQAGSTLKTTLALPGNVPGQRVNYRVIASRNERTSAPSETITVYGTNRPSAQLRAA
jgi:hypothetical protein